MFAHSRLACSRMFKYFCSNWNKLTYWEPGSFFASFDKNQVQTTDISVLTYLEKEVKASEKLGIKQGTLIEVEGSLKLTSLY
jgi:hypothetical protein